MVCQGKDIFLHFTQTEKFCIELLTHFGQNIQKKGKKVQLMFLRLLLLTLTLRFARQKEWFKSLAELYATSPWASHSPPRLRRASRARCAALVLLLVSWQEVTKKHAKTFPLGSPFLCRSTKGVGEKNIKALSASPAAKPPRAADMPKQKVLRDSKGY